MKSPTIEPEQKALEINLDDKIYGTFSEIGAGQEVARYFFQAGAAAGTIAKSTRMKYMVQSRVADMYANLVSIRC